MEVEVRLTGGDEGRAIAPAGASTGSGEALDLRDGGEYLGGYGVLGAVKNVNSMIAAELVGRDALDQEDCDARLLQLDGTPERHRLGGNAMIATSMALAHAAAASRGVPLWRQLAGDEADLVLPVPEVQIFGGGAHAKGQIELQDFMVVPYGAGSFAEATEWVAEIYLAAGHDLDRRGQRRGVADEGGYWPMFDSNEQAIERLLAAVESAGLDPQRQVGLSLDVAATQFYRDGRYCLDSEARCLTPEEWHAQLLVWLERYPIVAIEDPFVESDLEAHARLTAAVDNRIQVVGDDLLVTRPERVSEAAAAGACNTLLCKPNQAGTLTEARAAHTRALEAGWRTIASARSGESEDVTIVHLALGWGIGQLKVGSFARSERMAKWNEALRLEDRAGSAARYARLALESER